MSGWRSMRVAVVVGGLLVLGGCADPFEGTWEQVSGDSCGVSKFTVDLPVFSAHVP